MNPVRLVELISVLANVGVGLALFLGAGLLAKRSIAASSFLAIAAFFQIGAEIVQRGSMQLMMRFTPNPFFFFHVFNIGALSCLFAALIMAIRALPARTT